MPRRLYRFRPLSGARSTGRPAIGTAGQPCSIAGDGGWTGTARPAEPRPPPQLHSRGLHGVWHLTPNVLSCR
jgi:hypothetical protein